MEKVAKAKPLEAFVSPYLTIPPRTLDQALREREAQPARLIEECRRPDPVAAEQGRH